MGTFQNGLKVRHFNESLAQRPASSLEEVVTREQFYIKGEQSNTEKKTQDIKEHVPSVEGSHDPRMNNYDSPIRDKATFKQGGNDVESFMPLNTRHEQI